MLSVTDKNNILQILNYELSQSKNRSDKSSIKKDSLEISNTSKVFKKIDDFLNLGKPDRLSTEGMTKEEKDEFLKMLSILLKKGIVGYEVLEVDGKPEKHFIVNQIGNQRIYGAELYKNKSYFKDKLDY
ncbi:MAG: hypothetical protein K8F60_05325 [Melioribacteraceae bacterium]|nr:hypothetical protein [Melioribacteraceae bacterium]